MERLLLVRHAQAEGEGGPDPTLSATGVRQAQLLAERLADMGVSEVLHGPRRRAQETATLIAQRLDCWSRQTDLLEDRTPFPSADRWDDYPRHSWPFLNSVPVEERDEEGAAIAAAWARLTTSTNTDTVVAVTHAFVVGTFVSNLLKAPPSAWMTLAIQNASITDVRARPSGGWMIASVSDTGHLAGT